MDHGQRGWRQVRERAALDQDALGLPVQMDVHLVGLPEATDSLQVLVEVARSEGTRIALRLELLGGAGVADEQKIAALARASSPSGTRKRCRVSFPR